MTFDPLAFIELWIVLAFAAAWAVLEWQGRRLDRKREERDREAEREKAQDPTPHPAQESHKSPESRHPPG